jgi:FkbM family methyltransferase
MSITTKSAEALLWVYKGVNRMGLLNSQLARSVYVSAYFTYKKYLEDSYARLTKYHSYLFKNGHILDIGANIGYTSFVFSNYIDDSYKIVAFEPEARNLEMLRQASQKYRFGNKLLPVAAAVGDKIGEIELWRNEAHNGDHRIITDELRKQLKGHIQIQKTPLITIDHYIEKNRNLFPISFIKIDVQGYELAVCRGMSETLNRHPNAVISFEYCPSVIESLGFDPEDLLRFFKTRDYQFYFLNRQNHIEPYDIAKGHSYLRQIRPHDYIDILCARRNLVI